MRDQVNTDDGSKAPYAYSKKDDFRRSDISYACVRVYVCVCVCAYRVFAYLWYVRASTCVVLMRMCIRVHVHLLEKGIR